MRLVSGCQKPGPGRVLHPVLVLLVLAALPLPAAYAECPAGTYPVGDYCPKYLIHVPDSWNGDLVVFAHGYQGPTEEPAIEDYAIPPGNQKVSEIIAGMGYAFAATSYSYTGLVIPQAVEDVRELVRRFPDLSDRGSPRSVFLVGASEGGLVAALAIEKDPGLFDGGLAICGPVGDFKKQVHYFGDFLVLFNYFFPNVLRNLSETGETPTPEYVPEDLLQKWPQVAGAVLHAIGANPAAAKQLLKVSGAAVDPADPLSEQTILGLLWYGIFATNDANGKLGGCPYDNSRIWYSGSKNDIRLNLKIDRFRADSAALENIENGYQTSGKLASPLVTLHTTKDPIVPYWHEPIYTLKTLLSGSLLRHLNIPVARYGHCVFSPDELVTAFALVRIMAEIY